MKLVPPDRRYAFSAGRLALSLLVTALVPLLLYANPTWWSQRNVLLQNAVLDDYAPVNQGQLKNIATAAIAEMDAKLTGGAGEELHNLANTWSTPATPTNDFAPANLGQLKNVARPFYDRLIALGIVDYYPWLRSPNLSDDFAVANIGQTKNLFSFEIPSQNVLSDPRADRIAAGQYSASLALQKNTTWLWNDHLSNGSEFDRSYPRRMSGLPGVRSVSAGERYLVALANDGTVWTWGDDAVGQLGDGTTNGRNVPAPVPNLADIVSVKAGGSHVLALRADGTLMTWGGNYYGQLGTGDTTPSATFTAIPNLEDVQRIAASYGKSAALTTDGTVWTWGYERYDGRDIFNTSPAAVPDLLDVVDIAAGYEHMVALKSDGTVWSWGSNYANQIANGNPWWKYQDVPFHVPNLPPIVKVASSYDHTLAIASDGTVWAWGYNFDGQLGNGTSDPQQTPVQVSGLTDVIAIATAYTYSLAMKSDGTVWAWGDGAVGTLPGTDRHVPQQVGLGLFDSNHNGMDDRWEIRFLGNLNQSGDADLDGDGISNRLEYLRGTDPTDYYNGAIPIIEIVSGNNQVGDPGTFLQKPFKVRIRNSAGQLLVNAPVVFAITGGVGALATTPGDTQEQSVFVRTDANGEASVYHMLPDAGGISTHTTVSAGIGSAATSETFRGISRFVPPPQPTPTPDPNATPSPTPDPSATPSASPIAPYRYAIIDLGKDVYPRRINNNGWILCDGPDTNNNWGTFRWKAGTSQFLQPSTTNGSFSAVDINDEGTVVGWEGGSDVIYRHWVNNAVNEFSAALAWGPTAIRPTKLAGPSEPNWFPIFPGFIREASFSAIANRNAVTNQTAYYGSAYLGEGAYRWFNQVSDYHPVLNAQRWVDGAGSPTPLSFSKSTARFDSGLFPIFDWRGPMDRVTRANSVGHYIGSRITPNPNANPLGDESGMIDGQTTTFNPVDINEANMVVGNRPSDGAMIIRTPLPTPTPSPGVIPPPGPVPSTDKTIAGSIALALNDHTRPPPATVPQPSPTATPQPTPIPAPQVLSWNGNALVLWELQTDGKTWHPFGLEEMIPSMEGWDNLTPYDMNDNGLIVGTAWHTDPAHPTAPGEQHGFLLVPVEVMVDGNRDGEMSFDDQAVHDADQTSEDKPYRFWLNDDDDGAPGDPGEHVPPTAPDYADGTIGSARDLEDFARIHLNLVGFETALESGLVKAAFEWRNSPGSPRVKLYRASSGGTEYLTQQSAASASMLFPFRDTLGEVAPGVPLFVPQDFWVSKSLTANIPKTLPIAWFLFEGTGEGKGELVVSLWKEGRKIGQTAGTWIEIKNIKKLYQHQTLGGADPWAGIQFEPTDEEQKDIVVFVHGWRLSPSDTASFAETMFKRLWWRGFKGRFAAVRWDTYYNETDHGWIPFAGQAIDAYLSKYNDSEHNAWLSGEPLKAFVTNGLPTGYRKHLVAHSMGNVVCGAALQQGLIVDDYALLNAAIPAASYDPSAALQPAPTLQTANLLRIHLWDANTTPDDDPDPATRSLAYRGRLRNVPGNLVSFYLPVDFATSYAWELNNVLTKPPLSNEDRPEYGLFCRAFNYDRGAAPGHKLVKLGLTSSDHFLTDPNEAQPYACRTWAKAVGAEGRTRGKLEGEGVNLGSESFSPSGRTDGFGQEHSAEFNFSIQNLEAFYRELLRQLDIDQNP